MSVRSGGGGGGGGGGGISGSPYAVVYINAAGNAAATDPSFTGGALDPFQRPGVHDYRLGPTARGAVYRLGAWGMDGDPANVTSEGYVTYGANALGDGPDGSHGGMGFYTPNSFGVLQVIPGVNGGNPFYSCGFEDGGPMAPFGLDGFWVNDNADVSILQVRRSDATTEARLLRVTGGAPRFDSLVGPGAVLVDALGQTSVGTAATPGWPNAIAYENPAGTALITDQRLVAAPVDQFGRAQIRDTRLPAGPGTGAVLRQGAWTADGDPTDIQGEGLVVYGPAGGIHNNLNGTIGRVKYDRFQIRMIIGGVDIGSAWRVDPTHEFFTDNAGVQTAEIVRATGKATFNDLRVKSIAPRFDALVGPGTVVVDALGQTSVGAAGGGGVEWKTHLVWVDLNAPVPGQDGTEEHPWVTIQAALNSIPAPVSVADARVAWTVMIAQGAYDEDLTIPANNRRISLVGAGAWTLGLYDGYSWQPGATPRSITIDVTGPDPIEYIFPEVRIGTWFDHGANDQGYLPCKTAKPRISGDITVKNTGVNFQSVAVSLAVELQGQLIDDPGGWNGSAYFSVWESVFHSQIVVTYGLLTYARDSEFIDGVTLFAVVRAEHCTFTGPITVTFGATPGLAPTGFMCCGFGSITFTGPANSAVFDGTSWYNARSSGVTYAGGATVLLADWQLASQTEYTPTVPIDWRRNADLPPWPPPPTVAQDALDELADRVRLVQPPSWWNVPQPKTWIIGPNPGANYPDLITALASPTVVNGDVLECQAANVAYAATIVVNKRVWIKGQPWDPAVYPGVPTSQITAIAFASPATLIDVQVSGVWLTDLNIELYHLPPAATDTAVNFAAGTVDCVFDHSWVKTIYRCVVQRGSNWTLSRLTLSHEPIVGQPERGIIVYGHAGGSSLVTDCTYQCASNAPPTSIFLLLTQAGGDPWAGDITVRRCSWQGGDMRAWIYMDSFTGASRALSLEVDQNQTTGTTQTQDITLYGSSADYLAVLDKVTVRRTACSNTHGRGLVALAGVAPATIVSRPVFRLDGNSVANPAVTAPNYLPARTPDDGQLGYDSVVFGTHP